MACDVKHTRETPFVNMFEGRKMRTVPSPARRVCEGEGARSAKCPHDLRPLLVHLPLTCLRSSVAAVQWPARGESQDAS